MSASPSLSATTDEIAADIARAQARIAELMPSPEEMAESIQTVSRAMAEAGMSFERFRTEGK
ncbi:MAG: hypothetical protein ACPHN2_08725 [Sinimarinibacterium flocculans]|uniref:hypothetical protein n=1 Tax=Sinimarinibacterium flocculans TaxID=985250 RepID=UPI003C558FB9